MVQSCGGVCRFNESGYVVDAWYQVPNVVAWVVTRWPAFLINRACVALPYMDMDKKGVDLRRKHKQANCQAQALHAHQRIARTYNHHTPTTICLQRTTTREEYIMNLRFSSNNSYPTA